MLTSAYCAVHSSACIDSVCAGLLPHLASLSQAFSGGGRGGAGGGAGGGGLRKSVADTGISKGVENFVKKALLRRILVSSSHLHYQFSEQFRYYTKS